MTEEPNRFHLNSHKVSEHLSDTRRTKTTNPDNILSTNKPNILFRFCTWVNIFNTWNNLMSCSYREIGIVLPRNFKYNNHEIVRTQHWNHRSMYQYIISRIFIILMTMRIFIIRFIATNPSVHIHFVSLNEKNSISFYPRTQTRRHFSFIIFKSQ